MYYRLGDKIVIKDFNGNEFDGEIVNINNYREPSQRYAIFVEKFNDYVFIGENQIVRKQD